ncbi:hypothetical protein DUNSADRAFT_4262 [Dunaliella salina]|uniref:Encoded protein n=1 Tax=Dunaliella salina TaxID=3046 RepID=A0ABQ7GSF9_DUNSA|nr:hypothetical protein DUNSADRAFT_4262 [Dunaliella salina]|eukprot:KAF5837515.1 hypothetical protein DUNSADRAFT_4262 [Dunaliella salina]
MSGGGGVKRQRRSVERMPAAQSSECYAGSEHASHKESTASVCCSLDDDISQAGLRLDAVQAPFTPRAGAEGACPFPMGTAKLAVFIEGACPGGVMSAPTAMASPLCLDQTGKAQLSSSSTSRKNIVARRFTPEHSRPAPHARSYNAAPQRRKQQQQQLQCQANMLAAACTPVASVDDSFLGPQLTIRTPRPRISGITPEDCFAPSSTASLFHPSPRRGSSAPSSILASQLQASLNSIDGSLEQHCRGTPSRVLSSGSHTCGTPSRCSPAARAASQDLDSCVLGSGGSMTRLCK